MRYVIFVPSPRFGDMMSLAAPFLAGYEVVDRIIEQYLVMLDPVLPGFQTIPANSEPWSEVTWAELGSNLPGSQTWTCNGWGAAV